jgi:HD-like signal output (HDOD) protein
VNTPRPPVHSESLDAVVEALQWFEPFKYLEADDLLVLATKSSIGKAPARQRLFTIGDSDPWTICLIEGTLELNAADGRGVTVVAGTPTAIKPLAPLKPRQHMAFTVTPVTFLRIDGSDLGDLGEVLAPSSYSVQELMVTEGEGPLAEAVQHHELNMLSQGLELPGLPEVAMRARRMIDDESAGMAAIAELVMRDPAMAARLIRAANSPLFRTHTPVATCEQAIIRLGTRSTRQLILAFAARSLFHSETPALNRRLHEVWRHSNEVAAICYVIAELTGRFDPDTAMLAGLLHDIGLLPILHYANRQPDVAADDTLLGQLTLSLRAPIGTTLLQGWNFPAEYITAVNDAEDWWRDPATEPDMADLVLVAQLHSFIGKPDRPRLPTMVHLPAFRKLAGSEANPRLSQQILHEAGTQIAAAQELLGD